MALSFLMGGSVLVGQPRKHFAIFSTETTNPHIALDVTFLDQDPVYGNYDPIFEWDGRGSVTPTLGGAVIQDFGDYQQDRRLLIKDDNFIMSRSTRDALEAKYLQNKEWNFTDGQEVFRARFSKSPRGFRAWKNMLVWHEGIEISNPPPDTYLVFNYEIRLLVVSKLV